MDYLDKLIANRRRDRKILRLRQQGWTMQAIANLVGVKRQRVKQILDKFNGARP